MRVISGIYRSRRLAAPRGIATRPTSDRLRETLFDILGRQVEGALFADLFAGSGAVGIEALSRGASHVLFVEDAPPAVQVIRSNLASLKIESGFSIEPRSVNATLLDRVRRPGRESLPAPLWNFVFLDPPYQESAAYQNTLGILGEFAHLLAPGAVVIAEHSSRQGGTGRSSGTGPWTTSRTISESAMPLESYGPLRRTRMLKQGDAALSFYRVGEM